MLFNASFQTCLLKKKLCERLKHANRKNNYHGGGINITRRIITLKMTNKNNSILNIKCFYINIHNLEII